MANKNIARAYQVLSDGRLQWVYPEDAEKRVQPKLRSRHETDAEVRARLAKTAPYMYVPSHATGRALDKFLADHNLGARGFVDEPA